MKKIKDGNKPLWWDGKEVVCPSCGATYQLDQTDGAWINMQLQFNVKKLACQCEGCGGHMAIDVPQVEEVLPEVNGTVGGTGATPLTKIQPQKEGVPIGPGLSPNSSWGFLNNVLK